MAEAALPFVWAIIPARGGSKGVPGKNLKRIQGRSLVARAVYAARMARTVSRVFVSTDDLAIAAEARRAGAEVIDRPPEISGDSASSEEALLHALNVLDKGGQTLPAHFAFLQCTSPFLLSQDIDGTVAALIEGRADTAHSVTASHGFLWQEGDGGGADGVNHDKRRRPRRQDRTPEFLETGAVYVMDVAGFRAARHRFFGKTALYEVASLRAVEIDTPDDLAVARLLAPLLEPEFLAPFVPEPLGGLVFDFDGVMTDDKVILDETGVEAVICSRSDGFGIERLRALRIPMAVLSRESNAVVVARCRKLGLECFASVSDKLPAFHALCEKWNVTPSRVIYVGNDLPDIPCMEAAGLGVAVADAQPQVHAAADLTLHTKGGHGAVRELCDVVLAALSRTK